MEAYSVDGCRIGTQGVHSSGKVAPRQFSGFRSMAHLTILGGSRFRRERVIG